MIIDDNRNHDAYTELQRISRNGRAITTDQVAATFHGIDRHLIDPADLLTVQPGRLDRFLTDTGVHADWQASQPDPGGCPTWCNHTDGHQWTEAGPNAWTRDHTQPVTGIPALVEIVATETIDPDNGAEQTVPAIRIYDLDDADLTPDGARRLAAALTDAADRLSKITTDSA